MTPESFKRKLTAILSADAVGYSSLMGKDEEATVRAITAYREILSTLIQQHHGNVVDSPGDNLLAEFVSVVDAVQCAVDIQNEITARNDEFPENRRMQFRIGINIGDVIQEKERIYGDGVNIAARLEGLAEPGGICISKTAFDHIEGKLPYEYESLGDQKVKNIARPVGAYRVLMEPKTTTAEESKEEKQPYLRQKPIFIWIAAVLVWAVVVGMWQFYIRRPILNPASIENMAFPLPDKPSIAVLPFANLSSDSGQEYLADGITENIITALSYIPQIFVIARNSTFTYKGKAVKAQEVAENLGVRYILEGSVQSAGKQIRIIAQLIDATTGRHLWADRFDRELQDLFALQDEITLKIVFALQVKLSVDEEMRLVRDTPPDFDAWSLYTRGVGHWMRHSKTDNALARGFFEQAARLAPEYAKVITGLGWTHWEDAFHGWSESPDESLLLAVELAKKAQGLDNSDPMIHALWGAIYLKQKRYDLAITEGEKSVAFGPNQAGPHSMLAMVLYHTRRYTDALPMIRKAMRLNPYYPSTFLELLAGIYLRMEAYTKAIDAFKMLVVREPNRIVGHLGLAITYIRLGRREHARMEIAKVLRLFPKYSLEVYRQHALSMDRDPVQLESDIETLREAGLK